jgi:hypothetical protein
MLLLHKHGHDCMLVSPIHISSPRVSIDGYLPTCLPACHSKGGGHGVCSFVRPP